MADHRPSSSASESTRVLRSRRDFLHLLAGGLGLLSSGAAAQSVGLPRVGFVHMQNAASFPHLVAAFLQGMAETGLVDGRDFRMEYRWGDGHPERLSELVADLVSRHVAVIFTGGGEPTALAAKAATKTIPIVFTVGADPVALGLVDSLAHPGGNATGIHGFNVRLGGKRLGMLDQLVPSGLPIAVLLDPGLMFDLQLSDITDAATAMGRPIRILTASNDAEINRAFVTLQADRPGGLLVGVNPFFNSRRNRIVALVADLAIPAVYEQREFVLAGGLLSYGTSLAASYRLGGVYAARILRGARPADMPVTQSTRFELVVNQATAKSLGLNLPPTFLAEADEVIGD